jgi:hypothetical protein
MRVVSEHCGPEDERLMAELVAFGRRAELAALAAPFMAEAAVEDVRAAVVEGISSPFQQHFDLTRILQKHLRTRPPHSTAGDGGRGAGRDGGAALPQLALWWSCRGAGASGDQSGGAAEARSATDLLQPATEAPLEITK